MVIAIASILGIDWYRSSRLKRALAENQHNDTKSLTRSEAANAAMLNRAQRTAEASHPAQTVGGLSIGDGSH
ncbi:hypothetical protein [Nocardioides sp. Arc9.136]|uniref:hypothetical protein n=1 Tax=Nocardioides sp. Arc9.136 TaxID=2996826 RepID=UPI002666EECF|nr:hypothetical protein [Nocardioides sp. Arc9.136]WKN46604.1 hypothetical protein OSR43_11125 [Nocardioides sp. Arc9.136]